MIKKITYIIVSLLGMLVFLTQKTSVQAADETYVIATDTTFAPFEWQASDGTMTGIDMELLQAIAKNQNITVNVKALGFNAAVQALESEQVDGVIAGMSITDARKQSFDFSQAYYQGGVAMAVAADSTISTYQDLKGQKVAVKTGTEGAAFANKIKDTYGFSVSTFEDSANMYQDVLSGNSVAAFEDYPVMAYAIKAQQLALKTVGETQKGADYGFAVKKGKNATLLKHFNDGLVQLKASGEYDAIINKYTALDSSSNSEDTSIVGVIQNNGAALFNGLWQTLLLSAVSIAIALVIGVLLGLFSVSHSRVLKLIYTIYVDMMRGIPLLVLALFIYFAIPQFFNFRYANPFIPSVLTLALNAAAYLGELFRGGIEAIDKGQFEAAHSLGLPYSKTMRKIILPQAVKVMIPPFINQFVTTLKDTSLLSVIGLVELTQTGKLIVARTYASGNTWLVIAIMYIVIITCLTKLSKIFEAKMK